MPLECHLNYFLQLAEEAESHLFGREQIAWFDRLETEMDNLRAASSPRCGDDRKWVYDLVAALGWFY